ncbi:MAG: SUMF1/EgtB/PvdO family nonheme iron enzyme [Terrimicrobiaceae bacterium]|nr:SUMF1/EgtB/PvdO family nonheme iron enzyme [Terrimicrobiaceae bacterium]
MKRTKRKTAVAALGLALGMMATTGLAQITIPTVTVGDAGNANDSTGFGGVSYVYSIAVKEVNLFQYTAFLNAVAKTDTYFLYNTDMGADLNVAGIQRTGSSGSYSYSVIGSGSRPVTYVSWFDAARFANWMANGQPTGAQGNATTENGAYTLNGALDGVGFTKNAINPNTGTSTTWWIPSENEWYKAAFYDPTKGGLGGYWVYPTLSDDAPGNVVGSAPNNANINNGVYSITQDSNYSPSENYLTDGGAFSSSGSYYGTFDQGGNVFEFNDAVIGDYRGRRGGYWGADASYLSSSARGFDDAFAEYSYLGFRVASIPEPSTAGLMLVAGAAWLLRRRRKLTP